MTNHLTKRGAVYYFRRKIPTDLVEHVGRTQMMFSLETRDAAEAKRRAAEHTVSSDRYFDQLRGKLRPITSRPDEADAHAHSDEWEREYATNSAFHDGQDEGARAARETTDSLLAGMGLPTASQLAHYHATGGFSPDDLPSPNFEHGERASL